MTSLATFASSVSAAGGGKITTHPAENDWEVRKEGAPTPFFQEAGCEEKSRRRETCLCVAYKKMPGEIKGLKLEPGNRDKGWSRRYSVGDSQGGQLAPREMPAEKRHTFL